MRGTRALIAGSMILAVMFFLPTPCLAKRETGAEYTYKIAIERHLEDRLKAVLRDVAKGWSLVVVVNADVEGAAAKKSPAQSSKDSNNKPLLPGVPVREEIAPGGAKIPVINPADASVFIKSLYITVLVDSSAPEEMLKTIHDLAISVAGYNPDRGDRLEIRRVDFLSTENWTSFINPTNIIIFAISVVGIVFLSAAAIFFLNPFRSLSVVLKNVDWDSIRGVDRRRDPNRIQDSSAGPGAGTAHPQAVMAGRPQNSGAAAVTKNVERKGRFGFVHEENIQETAHLLREASAEDLSIVVSYIGPELSSSLLSFFPIEIQAEAASMLAEAREMDHGRVDSLEETLKNRLEYVVGGQETLASILDMADEEMRERTIMSVEQKDYDTANKVREKVKTFESIVRTLSSKDLLALIRKLDLTSFARVLNTSPRDIRDKVMESLEGGADERLLEEMKYAGSFPQERLKLEKRAIVTAYRELLEAGEIQEKASAGTVEG